MPSSKPTYELPPGVPSLVVKEEHIEYGFIGKLQSLKYEYRDDIRDRAALERNFRQKFEALNRVNLSDGEFTRLLDEIVTPDVFTAARTLRGRNAFTRDDGTPLNYTLVNIEDWCKNTFEVVSQLRVNTDYSHHRYDVLILINGVPCVQIELKTLGISPRRAMEQIVDYKNDPGNGYSKTLLCFLQLFIVSNRTHTWYFANNNARHFAFNADERFLPIYQFADEANKKITHLDSFAEAFLAKCTLGEAISRYMVLVASEQKLLMMRPYQVYAVKAIVDCIHQNCGNGYIWHTTGSGKTLTSFKASTLLKDTRFKKEKDGAELAAIATTHGLAATALQTFVDGVLKRLILDGDALRDLMAPLDLGWKARAKAETALMGDLIPLLRKQAQGREISGIRAYQPAEMVDDNKRLFRQILDAFLGRYQFALPDLFGKPVIKPIPPAAA